MNPVSYTYSLLKWHAKRRKIEFKLTVAEWEMFCEATGYIFLRGTTALSLSVDRIDNSGPYSIGNIQALALGDNSSKYTLKSHRVKFLDEKRRKYVTVGQGG